MPKKSLMKLCATCLSFSNFEFPVSEDKKGILRSLLYDFDFDEFIQAIPPDKQLTLCKTCNQTLLDMICFKERALRSFKEFKKYWCVNMSKRTTLYTVAAPSSSIIENVTSCDDIKIEDPKELKCEEPDPLEITKPDSESIHNIYDSLIDIKEEIDPSTLNQTEPNITNKTVAHKNNKEATPRNVNFNHNYVNNNAALKNEIFNNFVTTQNNINHNIGSVVLNNAAIIDISVNNLISNQVATKTLDSINHNFVNRNVTVPSNNQLNQNYVPIVSNMVPVSRNKIFNQNDVNNQLSKSRGSLNQNIAPKVRMTSNVPPDNNFNLNITTDNSYISNAAADSNDLENTIVSSLLIKSTNVLPVINDIAMLNNFNSSITNNPRRNNVVITTNSMDQNNKSIFKSVSMDNGQVVIGDENKEVKIDNRGNIQNVGQEIMCNPVPVSKDNDLVAPSCESANNSPPNKREDNSQNVIDGGAISASDSESEGEFPCDDEDKMKKNGGTVGMAVKVKKSHERTADKGQKKWYIKIVTREEILKKMEESRNRPDFLEAPHKCVSCVALFRDEWLAAIHRKGCHTEDSEFTCFACFRTFKEFHVLKAHYYVHVIDKCVYHCITCEFETRDIEYIKCHICPNAGSKFLPPKDPNTMKISKSRSLYYCHKCEYVTTRSSVLTTHYDTKHKNKVPSRIKCDECGKFYAGKDSLRLHKGAVHGGKKLQEEPVYCNLCNKWFSSKTTHYSHMKNLHVLQEELKFPCDECEKKFLTAKQLERHKEHHANVKEGVKNHKCNVCGNAYYTRNALRSHKVTRHEKKPTIRNHVCEVCGMAFYIKTTLQNHMARHSDARPYKCGVCGDTFKYSAAMRTHTKLKHTKKKNSDQSHQKDKGQEKRKKGKRKTVKRKRADSEGTDMLNESAEGT